MKNLLIIIVLLSFFSCIKKEDTKQDENKVTNINSNDTLNIFSNKDLNSIIKNYPVITNKSPTNKYYFIYSKMSDVTLEDKDLQIQDTLKEEYNIDNFIFKKGEFKWWFIYDFNNKKIIFKGSDLVLVNDCIWDENNGFFIFNFGMSQNTNLEFYNLLKPEKRSFVIEAYYIDNTSYLFSSDLNYISYLYPYKKEEESGKATSIGIKIKNLISNKVITINPENENSSLEIVKWILENELIYNEKENDGNVKEKKYQIE